MPRSTERAVRVLHSSGAAHVWEPCAYLWQFDGPGEDLEGPSGGGRSRAGRAGRAGRKKDADHARQLLLCGAARHCV